MKSVPAKSPVVIDLFCGAGGLSAGLHLAGFTPVLGVDFDKHAIATYKLNNPEAQAWQTDVSLLKGKHLLEAVGTDEVDLVAGGPSCQGFSTHGKRIEDDPRNFLFREFVRIVREVRPRFFLMENVKGLLSYGGGYFRNAIEGAFHRAGYRVISGTLLAADFGVPQLRQRVFFLGTRLDIPLSLPDPTHGASGGLFSVIPHVTVEEAISDLPLMEGDFERDIWEYAHSPSSDFQRFARSGKRSRTVTMHQANGLSSQSRKLAKHISQGEGLRSVPLRLLPSRFQKMRTLKNGELRRDCTTLYHRLDPEKPAYTITCNYRNIASGPFLHPYENRSLSHREAARLMSFPDSYQFSPISMPRQIGNAVPPLMARAVGRHIIDLMESRGRNRTIAEPLRHLIRA